MMAPPTAKAMVAQKELAIAVGEKAIMIIWATTINLNSFGNLFLMKKTVTAISADIMKMNQKELEDRMIVVKTPWRPPVMDTAPPISANVQPMNTSETVTKKMIDAIIRVLTRIMPATVASKLSGSGIVRTASRITNITIMFTNTSPKNTANVE